MTVAGMAIRFLLVLARAIALVLFLLALALACATWLRVPHDCHGGEGHGVEHSSPAHSGGKR